LVGLEDVMTCRGRGPITIPCPQRFDDLGMVANGLGDGAVNVRPAAQGPPEQVQLRQQYR
jgi:hypothetical protein